MWATLFDMKSNEWVDVELTNFPEEDEYEDAMRASDGGLVFFVPRSGTKLAALPILVWNPLTNYRKSLPPYPLGTRQLILVQLVMDEDTKSYRVILVFGEKSGRARGAVLYESRTGSWSIMNAGLAHGAGNTLLCGQQDSYKFDCASKALHNPNLRVALRLIPGPRSYSVVKGHLIMLEYRSKPGTYELTECDWDQTDVIYSMRILQTHSGALSDLSEEELYHPVLLPCSGFMHLTWDNDDDDYNNQVFKFYDRCADEWHDLPALVGDSRTTLEDPKTSLMCDLRWDAIPWADYLDNRDIDHKD